MPGKSLINWFQVSFAHYQKPKYFSGWTKMMSEY